MNRLFGFRNAYPQEFLDQLAEWLGIEWTKAEFKTVPRDKVSICPLGPPSGVLMYCEFNYETPDYPLPVAARLLNDLPKDQEILGGSYKSRPKTKEEYLIFAKSITDKFISMVTGELPISYFHGEMTDGPAIIPTDTEQQEYFKQNNKIALEWLNSNMLSYDEWLNKN